MAKNLAHQWNKHLRRVISHVWPIPAWRYRSDKRDLRLDLLRGFAVIVMIADHIGGERSWLYAITGGDAFFVSGAEVFVFISGLLMGMIYAGVITRQGLGVALMKCLQRASPIIALSASQSDEHAAVRCEIFIRVA